jgi:hypothetical protein
MLKLQFDGDVLVVQPRRPDHAGGRGRADADG